MHEIMPERLAEKRVPIEREAAFTDDSEDCARDKKICLLAGWGEGEPQGERQNERQEIEVIVCRAPAELSPARMLAANGSEGVDAEKERRPEERRKQNVIQAEMHINSSISISERGRLKEVRNRFPYAIIRTCRNS